MPLLALMALVALKALCYGSETAEISAQPAYQAQPSKSGYVLIILPQRNFIDNEYSIPKVSVSRAGYTVEVASTSTREIAIGYDVTKLRPNLTIEQIDTGKYKAVIYVGSYMNKKFFEDKVLIEKTREFASKGVLIGAMDNIPYFMAQWGLLKGVKVAVNPSLAKAVRSMGIDHVDKNIVIDKNFVTVDSQLYADQFATEFLTELNKR